MFTSADFAGPMRAAQIVVVIAFVMLCVIIGALTKRLSVQAHREWVANCIIQNVDHRPHEGLRAYCENLYYGTR